ncbi:MAG: hypothetical protein ACK2UO_08720 [Caldilineaceae bacterium]
MNSVQLRRTIGWIPLLIAFLAALAALIIVVWAALFEWDAGISWTQPLIGNTVGVARTYLFRNALLNTLAVLAPIWVSVFVLTFFASRRRFGMDDVRRRLPFPVYALAVAPLFLPPPYAVYLWRPLFRHIDMSSDPNLGLAAIVIVQVWRLWPLAILLAPLTRSVRPERSAVVVALTAVLLAFVDVATPLIMTGGEPYNDTHLWSTWSFHSLWVSRHWGFGAVMVGGMAFITGVIAGLIWLVGSHARVRDAGASLSHEKYLNNTALVAAACSALLPVAWLLPNLVLTWRPVAHSGEFIVEYMQWAMLSLLSILVTTLLAGLIASPALSAGVGRHIRIMAACFVVGMATFPIWDWVGLRWMSWSAGWYAPLVIVFATGITTGLVALWPGAACMRRNRTGCRRDEHFVNALNLLVVALLVTGGQFPLLVAVAERHGVLTLATGPALRLSTIASESELALATVLTYALVFSLSTVLAFTIRRTRNG